VLIAAEMDANIPRLQLLDKVYWSFDAGEFDGDGDGY
jgi:hypothetical protein